MADLTLDQALPVVQNLAGRKANAFIRRYGLLSSEREDVQSQLMLSFLAGWPHYDASRASIRTFASRVMDRELVSILRYRLAQSRQQRELPPRETGPSEAARRRFRVDIARALGPLPLIVRKTAAALVFSTQSEAADKLGCSCQMISERKFRIRRVLIAAGIGPDYFSAGGAQ